MQRPDRKGQTAATRANGRQQPTRRMGDKKQNAPLRRLFQNLQQGIGCIQVQIVGRVDDGHPIVRLRRALGEEFRQVAGLIYRDRFLRLAALNGPFQHQQIRMRPGRDQPGHGIVRARSERPKRRIRRGAQQTASGAVGESGLARALRPAQKPGVMQPTLAEGVQKGGLCRSVGDQVEAVARVLAHSRRPSTAAQTRAATAS